MIFNSSYLTAMVAKQNLGRQAKLHPILTTSGFNMFVSFRFAGT